MLCVCTQAPGYSFSNHLIGNMSQDYKDNTKKAEFLLFNNEIKQYIIIRNRDDLQKLWQHRNSKMLKFLIIILFKVYKLHYMPM